MSEDMRAVVARMLEPGNATHLPDMVRDLQVSAASAGADTVGARPPPRPVAEGQPLQPGRPHMLRLETCLPNVSQRAFSAADPDIRSTLVRVSTFI
ncbi:hypothetical protein Ait01nite_084600 [Actinoplanes italicus]|nr:hypothetical protein Ait01nite_084600 [Actinoplanes italicus]